MLPRMILAMALLLPACSADLEDKLGADGERCHVDEDCQLPLVCDDGVCSDGARPANNGSNNGQNNGFNNGRNNGFNNGRNNGFNNGQNNGFNNGRNNGFNNGQNNGFNNPLPEIEDLCKDVCEYFAECTGEFEDGCAGDCFEQLSQLPADTAAELLYCLLDSSCRDIRNGSADQCFGGSGVSEREQYCEDVSKYVADEVCPRQGVGEELYGYCTEAAQWHDDQQFWRLEECLNSDDCNQILECVYEWYEG